MNEEMLSRIRTGQGLHRRPGPERGQHAEGAAAVRHRRVGLLRRGGDVRPDPRDANPHHHQPGVQRRPHPRRRSCSSRPWTAQIEGMGSAEYLWTRKNVVPFLKVDKGLEPPRPTAPRLMKPMPGPGRSCSSGPSGNGVFGTKMRSVVQAADADRRRRRGRPAVRRSRGRSWRPGWCRSSSPRWTSTAPRRPRRRSCSRTRSLATLDGLGDGQDVMLKLTLPEEDDFYRELDRASARAAGGGALRRLQPRGGRRAARPGNHGVIASFSRALTEGLTAQHDRRGVQRGPRRLDRQHLRRLVDLRRRDC